MMVLPAPSFPDWPQLGQGVGGEDDGDLVAGQKRPVAPVVHQDADAVCIRVGAEQNVGSGLTGEGQRGVEGLHHLRVGDVEGHVFEGPAQVGGARAKAHLEPELLQHRIDRGQSGAVQRGIHDGKIPRCRERDRAHGRLVGAVDLLADENDAALRAGLIEGQAPDLPHVRRDLVDQGLVVGRDELAAVLVVDLFAVVGRQVVAGTEHVAGDRFQMPDGEGELRRAAGGLEQEHPDPIGGVDLGCGPRQRPSVEVFYRVGPVVGVDPLLSVAAHVEGQHHPALLRLLPELREQELRVSLGGGLDGPGVDPVGADADRAPAAPSPEGDHLVERIQQDLPFAGFYQVPDLRHVFREGGVGQPGAQAAKSARFDFFGDLQAG